MEVALSKKQMTKHRSIVSQPIWPTSPHTWTNWGLGSEGDNHPHQSQCCRPIVCCSRATSFPCHPAGLCLSGTWFLALGTWHLALASLGSLNGPVTCRSSHHTIPHSPIPPFRHSGLRGYY